MLFEDPSVKTYRGQSTTAWDEALGFLQLQLWDPEFMHGDHPRLCPSCKCKTLESNGLCVSAKPIRGLGGDDRDVLLVTRRWRCTSSKHTPGVPKNFHDTDASIRETLPLHVQLSYPVTYQTDRAGLTKLATSVYDCFAGHGSSVSGLVDSVNDMRMRNYLSKAVEHSARQAAVQKKHKFNFLFQISVGQVLTCSQ